MLKFYLVQGVRSGVRSDEYLLGNRVLVAKDWKNVLRQLGLGYLSNIVSIPEETEDRWDLEIEGSDMFKGAWITVLDVKDLKAKFFRVIGVDGETNYLDWGKPEELLRIYNFIYPFVSYAIPKEG